MRDGKRSIRKTKTTMTKGQEVNEEEVEKRKRRARAQEEEAQDQKKRRESIQNGPRISGKDGTTGALDTRTRESRTTKVGVAVT